MTYIKTSVASVIRTFGSILSRTTHVQLGRDYVVGFQQWTDIVIGRVNSTCLFCRLCISANGNISVCKVCYPTDESIHVLDNEAVALM